MSEQLRRFFGLDLYIQITAKRMAEYERENKAQLGILVEPHYAWSTKFRPEGKEPR